MNKVYIQITSGHGPIECCRVVVLVTHKIIEDAQRKGLIAEIAEYEECDQSGCMFSATLVVTGENINDFIKAWEGSILWIAQKNSFRPWHRCKNWFVGVHGFTPLETTEINERDIVYETLRSSGPGGQNVNKVESAVRATHIPTGISVMASDLRSQMQNKKLARERLYMKLAAIEDEKKANQHQLEWQNHQNLERGNPVKTFKGKL